MTKLFHGHKHLDFGSNYDFKDFVSLTKILVDAQKSTWNIL